MSFDVELCSFSNFSVSSSTSQLILQPFRRFTYITVHSPTLPSLYLRHSSVASPTPQFILQPFFRFSYVTSSSLNSPGDPTMPRVDIQYLSAKPSIRRIWKFCLYNLNLIRDSVIARFWSEPNGNCNKESRYHKEIFPSAHLVDWIEDVASRPFFWWYFYYKLYEV